MAYYNNVREYFDGALVLYQRDLEVSAPNAKSHRKPMWYMRIKVKGMKGRALVRSTKCTVYEEAYDVAYDAFLRTQSNVRLGHSLDEWSFEQHWNDWYNRNLEQNTWTESRQKWHKNYFKRYFSAYFSHENKSLLLNDIDVNFAFGYWEWRIHYWQSDEGKRRKVYNRMRKNAKTKSTNNAVKIPSHKTLKMEQSALNQIFYDAYQRGRCSTVFKFKSPNSSNADSQRAFFDDKEYETLYRYLRSYRNAEGIFKAVRANSWHKIQRQQMYYFCLFLANSGLRVGEARLLKWEDISFDVDNGESELIANVRVSANAKTRKMRNVQTQPSANDYLKRWMDISPYKNKSDYVFFGTSKDNTQQQFTDLNKTFQSILKKIPYNDRKDGLLYDSDGKRRSLYSLRHVYATQRLKRGVTVYDLSLNMGTRVTNIEKHYSHLLTTERSAQITQMPKRTVKEEVSNNTSMIDDAFAMFKEGKLSEEGLMQILALHKKQ